MASRAGKAKSTRRRREIRSPAAGLRDDPAYDSVGALVRVLYDFEDSNKFECPFWPPDLFGVVGSLLRRTGAYRSVFETPAPHGKRIRKTRREIFLPPESVGRKWRQACDQVIAKGDGLRAALPAEVLEWWRIFSTCFSQNIDSMMAQGPVPAARTVPGLAERYSPVEAALCLVIAADEACAGIGVTHHRDFESGKDDLFLWVAHENVLFREDNKLRSLCHRIRPDRLAVLPKQHTPQTGLTFRSLSHHLALCPAGELQARWHGPMPYLGQKEPQLFNFLLLPWPLKVDARDFLLCDDPVGHPAYGAFEYEPQSKISPAALSRWVSACIDSAEKLGGDIDVVVLPEVALSLRQYLAVERVAVRKGCMLISGVRIAASESDVGAPVNACAVQTRGLFSRSAKPAALLGATRYVQPKHHRWRLDRGQILQYGLGSRLPAAGRLWENIALPSRDLNFISLGPWMTWCALICEDLARQEPAAEIVRAIGPNLVIALLMDGPQLKERWAGRYASVLADDPGSSVLSMTNLGFASRSKPLETSIRAQSKPVIGLWRDAINGYQELSIEEGHNACVLSLVCHTEEEFTADGRTDNHTAYHPTYAGHQSFCVKVRN